ncbi:MAG: lactonase family protein [Planctomycetota bacterium]|nr:MAG: lactonase family protein [Planctomycetota bacterium]
MLRRFRVLLLGMLPACLSMLIAMVPTAGEDVGFDYRVYVGTYTGESSCGIYYFDIDVDSAMVGDPVLAAETKNPSFLAIHPRKPVLYAVGEYSGYDGKPSGAVHAFRIEPDGSLTLLNTQPTGGAGPCHVSVDATGRVAFVANYGGGSVAAYPVLKDGRLGAPGSVIQHEGSSVHPRQTKPHAHQIFPSPDNRIVLVPDLGLDKVLRYTFTPDGVLNRASVPAYAIPPGSGPRHAVWNARGDRLYVLNELNSTVTVFAVQPDGKATRLQHVSALPDDFDGENTAAEIVLHPTGRFLYTSNRGHDSIAVFRVADDGRITIAGHVPSGGRTPRNIAVDPTGRLLLSANQNSDNIVLYRIDPNSGMPSPVGRELTVGKPVCLVFRSLAGAR